MPAIATIILDAGVKTKGARDDDLIVKHLRWLGLVAAASCTVGCVDDRVTYTGRIDVSLAFESSDADRSRIDVIAPVTIGPGSTYNDFRANMLSELGSHPSQISVDRVSMTLVSSSMVDRLGDVFEGPAQLKLHTMTRDGGQTYLVATYTFNASDPRHVDVPLNHVLFDDTAIPADAYDKIVTGQFDVTIEGGVTPEFVRGMLRVDLMIALHVTAWQ